MNRDLRGQSTSDGTGTAVAHTLASRAGWTRIVAARRRDRRVIIPMTFVAAAGGWMWLGPTFAIGWLALNLAMIAGSHAFCTVVDRQEAPGPRWEAVVALVAVLQAAAYCALPFGLMAVDRDAAMAAGLTMIGAIALSAADEFVISRRIGGASLLVSFLTVAVNLIWPREPTPWGETALALVALVGFFGYVLQAAFQRLRIEAQMAHALRAAVEKEQEAALANAAKSTFLATISHEIRTPLNGVLGMAEVMATDELSRSQRDRLQVLRCSGEALTDILNDVLDLSKIEAGQLQIDRVAFELEDVLRTGVAAFAPRAAEKGLGLALDIGNGADGTYLGDPMRLRQVVYNLISNAVKFTATGDIRVSAERSDGVVAIAVTDTGPGVPHAEQARLFRKFEQLDTSTTRRHGGTGLGLAICRELCELMGGSIRLESGLGPGSTFVVTLPLERTGDRVARIASDEPAPDQGPSTGLRILAAEDNEVNRTVLKALLAQIGVEPAMVIDGAQAVAAWASSDWDLVLMDIQMPVMDGISAVREIRRLEQAEGRPRTPVIALTANAMTHQVAELRAAGMDGHVSKPINVARLFEAIAAATQPADEFEAHSVG